MEMMNVMYELATTKSALEMAETTIRKQRGKLLRKNILIAGLLLFGVTACRMLGESDEKRQKAEADAAEARENCARAELKANELLKEREPKDDIDICCDGKASITKKPE